MKLTIKKWGNSQGIILPKNVLEMIDAGVGDDLTVEVHQNKITLEKAGKKPTGEYDDLILRDLIDQGYSGNELYEKFISMRADIDIAFRSMAEEALEELKTGEAVRYE